MYKSRVTSCQSRTSSHLCIVFSTMVILALHATPLAAELPGQKLENAIMRLLEKDVRGTTGDLTTSQAVLFQYGQLEPVFKQSLREVQAARKIADYYQRRMPRTHAEWGQYTDALKRMQTGRERYQEALRNVIAARRPVVNRVLTDLVKSARYEIDQMAPTQEVELAALAQVQQQLIEQQEIIRSGTMPTIQWPPGIDAIWKEEIEEAVRVSVEGKSSAFGSWRSIERRIERIRRDLQATADELRSAAQANWEQLDDLEKKAFAELNVIAEAQIDIASNAMLQQTTIRRIYMAEQTKSVWKELN